MPHIYVIESSIGSDNGLSPIWRQVIIQTSAGLLSIGPLRTNFSEILIKIKKASIYQALPPSLSLSLSLSLFLSLSPLHPHPHPNPPFPSIKFVVFWIKFAVKGPNDNKPAFVQRMACHQIGNTPLSESVMCQFTKTSCSGILFFPYGPINVPTSP